MSSGSGLRVHAFAPSSVTNGPGTRAVLWVQGCTLACPGCFNPSTHGRGGDPVPVDTVFGWVAEQAGRIEGITISGGEPLQQRRGVLELLGRVRSHTSLSTVVFTGYRWSEVTRMPDADTLLDRVDVLVAGRYERDLPLGRGLRGSANQTVHRLTDRYCAADLDDVPVAEVLVGPDGALTVSGVDPPDLGDR